MFSVIIVLSHLNSFVYVFVLDSIFEYGFCDGDFIFWANKFTNFLPSIHFFLHLTIDVIIDEKFRIQFHKKYYFICKINLISPTTLRTEQQNGEQIKNKKFPRMSHKSKKKIPHGISCKLWFIQLILIKK